MTKEWLRATLKKRLAAQSTQMRAEKSNLIFEKLTATKTWQHAKTIGIYVSKSTEVETKAIIEYAWQVGKQVCVPKCDPENKQMTFYELTSFDQLEIVYFGLEEPIVSKCQPVCRDQIHLLIVPGLAFDVVGNRLGYGGGYYDRYLQGYTGASIGIAYDIQRVENVQVEKFDRPVDQVIFNR